MGVQVTTAFQRQEFKEALDLMEVWLYEDAGAAATAEVMYEKMLQLQKLGDPIKGRVSELERRPERLKAAKELTDLVAMATNSWPESKPWLNATQVADLKHKVSYFMYTRLLRCICCSDMVTGWGRISCVRKEAELKRATCQYGESCHQAPKYRRPQL